MIENLKIRILAGLTLVGITSFWLLAEKIPEIFFYYFSYPLLAFLIIFMPMFFGLIFGPILGSKFIRMYKKYHKFRKHEFRIYEGRQEHEFSRFYVSIISSLYPLGITFRIINEPIAFNEFDMGFITMIVLVQFIVTIVSYTIFIMSSSKIMVEFDKGISRFNIGEKFREKINYLSIGSLFLIIYPSYEAVSSSGVLFFTTLGTAILICFGSNMISFWIADKKNLFNRASVILKKYVRDPDYQPDHI